jgi:hypothetical protein
VQDWHDVRVPSTGKNPIRDHGQQERRKGRRDEKKRWEDSEGNNGTRRRDVKEQLRRRNERTTSEIYRKIIRLEVVKRPTEMSTGLLKVRNWALWRGKPPLKRRKTLIATLD